MILLYLDILDGKFVAGDQCNAQSRERVRKRTNCYFLLSNRSIEGFLFDSLIGRFPPGSKIYIFGLLLKSVKILIIRLIWRYMTTVVYLITVWQLIITPETLPLIIFELLNVFVFPNGWYITENRNIASVRWFPTEKQMILWGWVTRWVCHVEKLRDKWWKKISGSDIWWRRFIQN